MSNVSTKIDSGLVTVELENESVTFNPEVIAKFLSGVNHLETIQSLVKSLKLSSHESLEQLWPNPDPISLSTISNDIPMVLDVINLLLELKIQLVIEEKEGEDEN